MNKLFKFFGRIFKAIYNIIDKLIVLPISKLIYQFNELLKNNSGKIEKILNRPNVLIYVSLICAAAVFLLIDMQVLDLTNQEAEIISGQEVKVIYNQEEYVVEGVPETIDITLIGSKSNLYLAKQIGEHEVILDLTGYSIGTYKVKLTYNHSITSVNYKLDPSTVTVKISKKESAIKPLTYDLLNEDKDSKLTINEVELGSSEVIVKGSKEALENVANVKALIDLKAADIKEKGEYTVDSVTLVAYDNEGNKMENIEVVPNKVSAKLKVESYYAELPVKVVTKGTLTSGYAISSITNTVSKVEVYGEKEVIDQLSYIEASIDISALSSDKTFNVNLTKPNGVRYMSESSAKVTVTIDAETSKTFEGIYIESINKADGYKLITDSDISTVDKKITTDVIVKGEAKALENLDPTQIKAYVDLSGYTEGQYELEIKVSIDDPRFTVISTKKTLNIKVVKE